MNSSNWEKLRAAWNANTSLKETVRRYPGIDKQEVVKVFRHFSRLVGYSNEVVYPVHTKKRPYATDWRAVSPGIEYSPSLKLYWSPSRSTARCESSATWAGWIGPGATLRNLLSETAKLRSEDLHHGSPE